MDLTFNLTRVFRQKDQEFVDMLNEMRFGHLSQKSVAVFSARSGPLPDDGIAPTEL
jgi:ATP-dependent DNA helicase PIF1